MQAADEHGTVFVGVAWLCCGGTMLHYFPEVMTLWDFSSLKLCQERCNLCWNPSTRKDMVWKIGWSPIEEKTRFQFHCCLHNGSMLSLKARHLQESDSCHPGKLAIFLLALCWISSCVEVLCDAMQEWVALWTVVQNTEPTSRISWWCVEGSFIFQTVDII